MKIKNKIPGWRYFNCNVCGTHWKEYCLDYEDDKRSFCLDDSCPSILNGGVFPYQAIKDSTGTKKENGVVVIITTT